MFLGFLKHTVLFSDQFLNYFLCLIIIDTEVLLLIDNKFRFMIRFPCFIKAKILANNNYYACKLRKGLM
jgi:hypothetical protein